MSIWMREHKELIEQYETIGQQTGVSVGGRDMRYEVTFETMEIIRGLMREEINRKIRTCEAIMTQNNKEFIAWVK